MNAEFLATVAVITPDPAASRKLYVEMLGLPLEGHGGDYYHSEQIAGCKSFGIWPLSQAAEACFGTLRWPAERPVPQVSIEFDVADVAAVAPAARELEQAGYELLHAPRQEPWGQTVARLQSPGGCDRRDLIHAYAARRGLTQAATRSIDAKGSGLPALASGGLSVSEPLRSGLRAGRIRSAERAKPT